MSDLVIADKSEIVNIANAVRSLTGSTTTMNLSGMKSHLNTTKTSIDNAFATLSEKGVDISNASSPDVLASLIASIEAGGGGDIAPFSSVVCGTFTSRYTKELTIDGVSNCKIFAMRCVENDYYSEDDEHTISAVLVNSEASSAISVGAVKGVSAYFSPRGVYVQSAGMYPTISGDTLTFSYYLLGTYEYVMVSK